MIWSTSSYGLWQLCYGAFAISFNSLEGTLFDESVIRLRCRKWLKIVVLIYQILLRDYLTVNGCQTSFLSPKLIFSCPWGQSYLMKAKNVIYKPSLHTIPIPNSCFLPILWFQNFDEYFQDFHNISPIYFFFFNFFCCPVAESLQKGMLV